MKERDEEKRPDTQGTSPEAAFEGIEASLRRCIEAFEQRIETRNDFTILGLDANASSSDPWGACLAQLEALFASMLPDCEAALVQRFQRVLRRVTEACKVLSNPSMRATYRRFYQQKGGEGGAPGIDPRHFESSIPSRSSESVREGNATGRAAQEAAFQRGRHLLRTQRYLEAAAIFQRLAREDPGQGKYHAYLGWTLYQNAEGYDPAVVAQAKSALSRALCLDGNDPHALLFLGNIYADEEQYLWAAEIYRRILRRHPDHRMAQLMLEKVERLQAGSPHRTSPLPPHRSSLVSESERKGRES
ncbi:MAG: hypothetical protein D6812_17350 [Deltaproteobacteria bacterium]|nr:MAG: hypothetical protein D6812_17350 [Deltaproteobacteria bacterium]